MKSTCGKGHQLEEVGYRWNHIGRSCDECTRDRARTQRELVKSAAAAKGMTLRGYIKKYGQGQEAAYRALGAK